MKSCEAKTCEKVEQHHLYYPRAALASVKITISGALKTRLTLIVLYDNVQHNGLKLLLNVNFLFPVFFTKCAMVYSQSKEYLFSPCCCLQFT